MSKLHVGGSRMHSSVHMRGGAHHAGRATGHAAHAHTASQQRATSSSPSAERPDAKKQAEARARAAAQRSTNPLDRAPNGPQKTVRDPARVNEDKQLKNLADRAGLGGGGMDLQQLLSVVQNLAQRRGASGGCSGGGGGCNGGGGGCNGGGGGGGNDASVNNNDSKETFNGTEGANGDDAAATKDFVAQREKNLASAEEAVPKDDPLRKLSDAALEKEKPTTAVANELTRRAASAALEAGKARADVVKSLHGKIDGGKDLSPQERRALMTAGEQAQRLQEDADRRASLAQAAKTGASATTRTRDAA